MDAILTNKAEQLAREIASEAKTLEDLNGLMKVMMKSALERMLDTEMDVHLGRKKLPVTTVDAAAQVVTKHPSESVTRPPGTGRCRFPNGERL
jgi:hypothetical protein